MKSGALSNLHPFLKILITLGVSVFAVLVVFFLGAIMAILLFHVDVEHVALSLQDYSNPDTLVLLKYLQILQTLFLFIVPAVFLSVLLFRNGIRDLGFHGHAFYTTFFSVLFLIYFGFPLVNMLAEWNSNVRLPDFLSGLETKLMSMEEDAARLTEAFLNVESFAGFLANMFMIALLPAVGEELFFRGLIQKHLIEWTRRPWLGILLASAFFSFIHLQFYGFVPRLYLGVVFGLIYYWSGSIWLPMLAHFLNNGTAVVIYYIFGQDVVEKDLDTIGTTEGTWYIGLISLIVVFTALYFLYQNRSKNLSTSGEGPQGRIDG